MGKTVIIINSATQGYKAREILARRGIRTELFKGAGNQKSGCLYNLFVYGNIDRAEAILRNAGILISGRTEVTF